MRTQNAPTIRLKNYTPPAYTIEDVELKVQLDPHTTQIKSKISFSRERGIKAGTPLCLDGDELKLISISLDGRELDHQEYKATPQALVLRTPPKTKKFILEVVTELAPVENKKLMGLYQSNGVYCTQCEAEGFRRITYFLDRPDVLAVYTVRLEADRTDCPILLANGNRIKCGKLANNRHYAIWHDPHPKPSYLFAMVGGDLDVYSDKFKTASNRKVDLNIYVETGKAELASYAMGALKRSMVWDEEVYGREYDLDVFNIVAVSDFNMGAMENKGLNVFNDKYILASPDLATDTDFMHIEAIIGHEYFHNWTGNRITCRDWFQLCLKEGLTVYRDQEFSADLRSRAVQRIQQVRILKSGQFPEDAGPLAHSVRPEAYREINNFYTATVYQKGAELVRMLATIVGPKAYRKATDLYFKRHDGEAAVVEDWLKSFEDTAKIDLTQFSRWYGQAGTPTIEVKDSFDKNTGRYKLNIEQSLKPTPGQKNKRIVPIPIRFGLMDRDGNELPIVTKSKAVSNDVILMDKRVMSVTFEGLEAKPIPSLLRGFSAPVHLKYNESDKSKVLRAQHDKDLYNRWEALNGYALQLLIKDTKSRISGKKNKPDERFLTALIATTFDETLEPAFKAQALAIPSGQDVAREIGKGIDPDAIYEARKALQIAIGKALENDGLKLVVQLRNQIQVADEAEATGIRSLANTILPYLVLAKINGALELTQKLYSSATTMTDRLGALHPLLYCQSDNAIANAALDKLFKRYRKYPLVIDKWFSIQASLPGNKGLKRIKELSSHPLYSLENPNRARSLLGVFAAGNLSGFHRADGKGYKFYADQILAIDKINPQLAARLLTLMNNWKMFEKQRATHAKRELTRIAKTNGLSRDTQEIVDRALG
ncbi:MAG: aminopeptidase N [Rhizobiaceae bacterium]